MTDQNGKPFALFLGCTIPLRFPFMESASRKIMNALEIKTQELPFGCCPDPNGVQSFDKDTWATLAARNLCLAEEAGLDILTLCNGCYETLKVVNEELKHDSDMRTKVNKILGEIGKEYKGTVGVHHIVPVLHQYRDKIKELVKKPLTDRKFAIHYGCHLLRPAELLQTDDPEHPVILDELVEVLEGTTVPYLKKGMCCGAGVYGTDLPTSVKIIREKLVEVNKGDVDAMVVCCPTCFRQYEGGQTLIKKDFSESYGKDEKGIPVVYYTEILAYAFGLDVSEEFKQHRVKLNLA